MSISMQTCDRWPHYKGHENPGTFYELAVMPYPNTGQAVAFWKGAKPDQDLSVEIWAHAGRGKWWVQMVSGNRRLADATCAFYGEARQLALDWIMAELDRRKI